MSSYLGPPPLGSRLAMLPNNPAEDYAECIILPLIAIMTVALRFKARRFGRLGLGYDDWAQMPALLLFIGMCIVGLIGASQRIWYYPHSTSGLGIDKVNSSISLLFSTQLLAILCISFIRSTALAFYYRTFCPSKKSVLARVIVCAMVVTVVWGVAFFVFILSLCGTHLASGWSNSADFEQYCFNQTKQFNLSSSITDTVIDLAVLLIPLYPIWKLKITLARRLAISGVFSLGLIGLTGSLGLLALNIDLSLNTQTSADHLTITRLAFLNRLESGVALMAVNLPPTWGLLVRITPSWLKSIRDGVPSVSMRRRDLFRRDIDLDGNRDSRVAFAKEVEIRNKMESWGRLEDDEEGCDEKNEKTRYVEFTTMKLPEQAAASSKGPGSGPLDFGVVPFGSGKTMGF